MFPRRSPLSFFDLQHCPAQWNANLAPIVERHEINVISAQQRTSRLTLLHVSGPLADHDAVPSASSGSGHRERADSGRRLSSARERLNAPTRARHSRPRHVTLTGQHISDGVMIPRSSTSTALMPNYVATSRLFASKDQKERTWASLRSCPRRRIYSVARGTGQARVNSVVSPKHPSTDRSYAFALSQLARNACAKRLPVP